MKVGIVGAGIAGLSAGRELHKQGHQAVLFEKSRGPGGRCATRRRGDFFWDSGATSILPRGKALEQVILEELPTDELTRITLPVATHENLRVRPGDPRRGGTRYCYQNGMNTLAKLLATGLDIRPEVSVDAIEKLGEQFKIAGEIFDAVILTCPIPQTSLLLWGMNESRPIGNVRYRPCISVLLGYETPLPETHYFAVLDPEQSHPLTWLSLESNKVPGRPPTLVAQMNRTFSAREYDRADADLVSSVSTYIASLIGNAHAVPAVSDVMRWKYSQPESFADFGQVNPPGSKIILASDGLLGGHLEDAYEVGLKAARMLAS